MEIKETYEENNEVFIDPEKETAFIAEKTGLSRDIIDAVLEAQVDYLDTLGLVTAVEE